MSDAVDPNPVCTLSITSSEAADGKGDGHTRTDWKILDPHHVRLRAERSGGGSGRIYYTPTVTCTDRSGNTARRSVTVSVPKSKGSRTQRSDWV